MATKFKIRSVKVKRAKSPEEQVIDLGLSIGIPAAQLTVGEFRMKDVANKSDADQRHSIRSGETRTVRRLTRIEKLQRGGTLTRDEAAACQWYADAYELGFATLGITADYGANGGGGCSTFSHLARYRAQEEARKDYWFAREAIPAPALEVFEAVVLHGNSIATAADEKGRKLSNYTARFRFAASALHERICHLLPIT